MGEMPVIEDQTAQQTTNTNNSNDTNSFENMESNKSLVYSLLINISKIWRNYSRTFDSLLERYGAYEVLDWIVLHLSRHPFIAFGMSICVLSCALPFIIFMVFAIATVIMTFTGFVIIEGTLITVASALLFGFLGSVIIFFLFFAFVLLAGYFGLVQIYEIFDHGDKKRTVPQFVHTERTRKTD